MTDKQIECAFHFTLQGIHLPDSDKERIKVAMYKTMLTELAKVDLKGDLSSLLSGGLAGTPAILKK